MTTTALPYKRTLTQRLAIFILNVFGWQMIDNFPDLPKYVIVGAPHTSNWDFVLAMLLMFGSGVRFNFIGKDSLFRFPHGWLFHRLGGIPVCRDRRSNFVAQIVEAYEKAERMIIAIAPEGTRSKSPYWKTGFYYIAVGAKVPIVLGFIDYGRKQVGVDLLIHPTGDIHADFAIIRDFYADKTALYPKEQGPIELQPTDQASG